MAAPMRPVGRAGAGVIQDYTYVRSDLVRTATVTGLLLGLMAVLVVVIR